MTNFKAATCPNCGGDLQLPTNVESVKCMYCGSDIVIQDALAKKDNTVDIENLLSIADTALAGSNYDEAYNYYNQILEADLTNYYAWYGKAISALWLSTVENPRFSECKPAILKAFKYCPDDQKQVLGNRISNKFGEVFSSQLSFTEQYFANTSLLSARLNARNRSIKSYDKEDTSENITQYYADSIKNVIKAQGEIIHILADHSPNYPRIFVDNFLSNAKEVYKKCNLSQIQIETWVDDIYRYAKENGYTAEHPKESKEVKAAKKSAEKEAIWGCLGYILVAIIALIIVAGNS